MEKDVRRQGSKVLAAVLSVSAAAALGLAAVFVKSFAPKKPDAAKPEAVAQPQPEASEVKAQRAPAPAQEVKGPAPSVADKPDSDRAQGRDQGAPTLPSASVQELEAQLKALKEVEDENAKLRAFLAAHLQTSEKVNALAEENKALKMAQVKLEHELEEARNQTRFSLSSGQELELFKGLLSQRLHKGASSVRSVTTADGGESVGAATVTGATVGRSSSRNPGFFSELAQLLMLTPPPPPPPKPGRAGSKQGSQAGSVKAPSTTASRAKSSVPVDAARLLDAYSGGLGRM